MAFDGDFFFPTALTFAELDDTPVRYRIDGLWPYQSHMLFSAYRKAGKTSSVLEMLHCLATGEDFLGRGVSKVSDTIVYVNLELSQQMLRKYASERGIDLPTKKIKILDYRGYATRLDISDPEYRAAWAKKLTALECEILVIDPISPIAACQARESNGNDDMRALLEDFGELAEESGCDLQVVDHTGHAEKTRSRGASAKEDWADVIWNLQTVGGEESRKRKLTAIGRGIDPASISFFMDENGDFQVGEAASDGPYAPGYLMPDVGQTKAELAAKTGQDVSTVGRQLTKAEQQGSARREERRRGGDLWYSS